MGVIKWLEQWYLSNCDGDWEHGFGVSISTLDNPGWTVKLNISLTLYEDVAFDEVKIDRTEHDWVYCKKDNWEIMCAGGPKNLEEMLEIIKNWMESNKPTLEAVNAFNQEVMERRKFRDLKLPD